VAISSEGRGQRGSYLLKKRGARKIQREPTYDSFGQDGSAFLTGGEGLTRTSKKKQGGELSHKNVFIKDNQILWFH